MKEDLLKIINNYGVSHQLRKFNEECYELKEAIIRYEFAKFDNETLVELGDEQKWNLDMFKEHIIEEIGDNFVLLYEFMEYYGITNDKIKNIMKQKIPRTIKRMEEENEQ